MEDDNKTSLIDIDTLVGMGIGESNIANVALHRQLGEKGAPLVALRKGFDLVNLDQHKQFQTHYRAAFETHLIKEFSRYCKTNKIASASNIFVDHDRMQAVRIFDLGDTDKPGHCLHTACLRLKETPAYHWLESNITKHSNPAFEQLDLVNLITDWREHMTLVDGGGKTIPLLTGLNSIRGINIEASLEQEHVAGNMSESSSSMEQIEIQARGNKQLPAGIKFKCVPFYGLEERTFEIQISASLARDKKPKLKLRTMGRDVMAEKITQEFVTKIGKEFTADTIVVGCLSTGHDYSRRSTI